MTELDERKAAILRAIVEQYVDTAQPVGLADGHAARPASGVSAATVRNEMSLLEREGYIAQPHTVGGPGPDRPRLPLLRRPPRRRRSAARRPSGAGSSTSSPARRCAMDELLPQTSQLLAGVTAHAAVVVGPRAAGGRRCAAANLVLLQPRVVLAVVVLSNGAVEKEIVVLDDDALRRRRRRRQRALRAQLAGRRLADVAAPVATRPTTGRRPPTATASARS